MKDMLTCGTAASAAALAVKDAVYKEVVVVGNGPSGIALSYMLAGNWPYWSADRVASHPDELLRARLNYAGAERSLVQHDLEALADGLEGRSTNPVSLLLDSLQNPCADIGMTLPTMLQYRHHADRRIDHVVLGKGPPGGSWHRMDPNLRTLSLATWMSLPGYDYQAWEEEKNVQRARDGAADGPTLACKRCAERAAAFSADGSVVAGATAALHRERSARVHKQHDASTCNKCVAAEELAMAGRREHNPNNSNNSSSSSSSSMELNNNNANSAMNKNLAPAAPTTANRLSVPRRNMTLQRQVSKEVQTRALVSRVAEYYEAYVARMRLTEHFVNDTVVTSVQPIADGQHKNARWIVQGKKLISGKPFAYVCRNVVLAVGASDLPNRLGLHGESLGYPWIKHELPQLEMALEKLTPRERSKLKPVLIIGAGLSAADAVTICRSAKVPVIHVYRNSSVGLDKMLPEAVYPEYHAVHKMMKQSAVPYDLYTPLAEHTLVGVHNHKSADPNSPLPQHHQITLLNQKTGEQRRFDVSYCAILIGSRPDLRLLRNVNQPRVRLNSCTSTTTTTSPSSPAPSSSPTSVFEQISNTLRLLDGPAKSGATTPTSPEHWLLGRKLSWLKSLCAKCRTMNICEWSATASSASAASSPSSGNRRHTEHRKSSCYNTTLLPTLVNVDDVKKPSATSTTLLLLPAAAERRASGAAPTIEDVAATGDSLGAATLSLQLGEDPLKPIDCKTNPIAVHKYTNEVQRLAHGRSGLYAMGPLVGDNFVRFISGGALAITSALHREND